MSVEGKLVCRVPLLGQIQPLKVYKHVDVTYVLLQHGGLQTPHAHAATDVHVGYDLGTFLLTYANHNCLYH